MLSRLSSSRLKAMIRLPTIKTIRAVGRPVFTTREIALLAGGSLSAVSHSLKRMERQGIVRGVLRGLWCDPSDPRFTPFLLVPLSRGWSSSLRVFPFGAQPTRHDRADSTQRILCHNRPYPTQKHSRRHFLVSSDSPELPRRVRLVPWGTRISHRHAGESIGGFFIFIEPARQTIRIFPRNRARRGISLSRGAKVG